MGGWVQSLVFKGKDSPWGKKAGEVALAVGKQIQITLST